MIRKREKLLITFYTTTDAMAMERLCRENGMPGRIVPVPGTISADCGLGWCAEPGEEARFRGFLAEHSLNAQGIHHCLI